MCVRTYVRAFAQKKICVPASRRHKACLLPFGESSQGVTSQRDPRRLGFSHSGKNRGPHGDVNTRPEPYRPPVDDGGNITATAMLVGGCVLAVGVVVLAAIRYSQIPSGDAASPAPSTAAKQISDVHVTDTEIEYVEPEVIEIPDIATPDNPDAPKVADHRQNERASPAHANSTDVAPSEEKDEPRKTTVPGMSRISGPIAVPKYNRPNPYAEVQTVDLIDDARGQQVMASLKEICVHVVPLKSDVRGGVSAAVSSGVRGALERCQLSYRGGISEPIMLVQLHIGGSSDVPSLSMTAMLLVNRESRMLKVWQKTGEIGAITDQALRKGILPPKLNRGVRGFFTDLRSQFVEVRRQFAANANE